MGAAAKIEIFQNGQLLQEIPLQGEMWVGRDEACPVHLDDRAISRKHALIRMTPQGIEFENKSKFGWAKINGQEQSQATLKDGDRVEMGPYEIRVLGQVIQDALPVQVESVLPAVEVKSDFKNDQVELNDRTRAMDPNVDPLGLDLQSEQQSIPVEQSFESSASLNTDSGASAGFELNQQPVVESQTKAFEMDGSASQTREIDNDGATKILTGMDKVKPVLVFAPGSSGLSGSHMAQYEIHDAEISIGRSQHCHVVLDDKRSSRKHAIIRRETNQYVLRDLGSANGTLVNDQPVSHEVTLQSGDRIQIGDTAFTFQLFQGDYEKKKEQFINVPPQEAAAVATPLVNNSFDSQNFNSPALGVEQSQNAEPLMPPPQFAEPEAPKKKSLLSGVIERYRMMSTRQQIIYGAAVLGLMYMLMDEEPEVKKPKVSTSQQAKKVNKEKKVDGLPTFETLTPEQKNYIEVQYQRGFDLYKNREYDNAIFEIEKIFRLVQDYKQAREIHSYAIEGKRQLEAREEERKRQEKERQDKVKLQMLVDQAGTLIEKKKFREAEALFPEIELLEPENSAVSAWRKLIASEDERLKAEEEEHQRLAQIQNKAEQDFKAGKILQANKAYYDAIDQFEEILDRQLVNQNFIKQVEAEVEATYKAIADARDPLIAKGNEAEKAGNFPEAYRAYEDALKVDPESEDAPVGMKRIRGTLSGRARAVYTEGVFAESFNDFDNAEKKYREVLEVVPKDDEYYEKAQIRLKKITVFKKPVAFENGPAPASEGVPQ